MARDSNECDLSTVKIGEFELEREIGRGGVGVVFSGRSPLGAPVAVKLLKVMGADDKARFEREQRLLGKLGAQEGFVPLLESGVAPAGPYIVMPFVGGGTLRERLHREGRLSVAETVALGAKLARALGRAHALGVIHRDVKPENVLYTGTPAPPRCP